MRDRPARAATVLLAMSLALVAGCGGDDEPLAAPQSAAPSSLAPSPSPSASPSPSPSPEPLSAFEDDPAVQGLRAYYVAAARAINVDDFTIPEMLAASTAARAEENRSAFAEDLGAYVPGPTPFTPLEVQEVAPDRRTILGCAVDGGWVLDRQGGTPTEPDEVVGGRWDMVLQDGVWKVEEIDREESISCERVRVVRRPVR